MEVSTPDLQQGYAGIIDRLDQLYSLSLNQTLTASEQGELDELRQRALMIQTELSQRARIDALFA